MKAEDLFTELHELKQLAAASTQEPERYSNPDEDFSLAARIQEKEQKAEKYLSLIPPSSAAVLRYKYVHGFSEEETAAALSHSVRYVRFAEKCGMVSVNRILRKQEKEKEGR